MLKGAVARRYAEAVMEIAQQQGTVERWLADVRLIGEAFGNRQLAFVLREPRIPLNRKEAIVRDLLANKVQHDALNLALLLTQDGLSEAGPRLAQEFERLYDEYRGQAKAQVTSALPLDDAERSEVASALQRVTGKRIILEERVDPEILGGVMARVGDTLIDGSVRRRLALLREQIVRGGGTFGGPADGAPVPGGGPSGGPTGEPAPAAGGGFVVQPAAPSDAEPESGPSSGGAGNGAGPTDGTGSGGTRDSAGGPASIAEEAPRAPSVAQRPRSLQPGRSGQTGAAGQANRHGKRRRRR